MTVTAHLTLRAVAIVVAVLGAGGALVVVSGIAPIEASSGHWKITEWFLHFAMRRSVSTHAMGIHPPDLTPRRLAVIGGGHYDLGCSPCHGTPEFPFPQIGREMTPKPPYLAPRVPEWSDAELFYIVKHGVKFTGMPAWPSPERDDEVWTMVAFLRKFAAMDSRAYKQMTRGEALESAGGEAIQTIARVCSRCHGFDGLGRGDRAFPLLAGQRAEYLRASLYAFASGERHSGIMRPVASVLTDAGIDAVVRHYSSLPAPNHPSSTEFAEKGRVIAQSGVPSRLVPACVSCHGPSDLPRAPRFPILNGQPAHYLVNQLELLQQGKRGGTDHAHLMKPVANRLSASEIRAVAAYFESEPRDPRTP